MARSKPPTMRTSPTPTERSSCTLTILSAISVNSRSDRSPETAIVRIGESSLLNFEMTGGSTSSRQTIEDRSDPIAHILSGDVDVTVEVERRHDERGSPAGYGTQLVYPFDRVDDLFNRL